MKLKKGSAAAKVYMAKIRSKRKTAKKKPVRKVGATLLLEKGESRKTKPARVVQVQRTKKGAFKKFATIGSATAEVKNILEEKIKNLYIRTLKAKTKREKTKIGKELAELKRKLKKINSL